MPLNDSLPNQDDQDSLVHLLPPEILSKIFLEAFSGPKRPFDSLYPAVEVLGRVCSRWRQTVYSLPPLWTEIHVILETHRHATKGVLSLLKLYVDHSSNLLLDIEVDLRSSNAPLFISFPDTDGRHVPYTAILDLLLVENQPRIRSLSWGREHPVLTHLYFPLVSHSTTITLPNLKSLFIRLESNYYIHIGGWIETTDPFEHVSFPSLHYVGLRGPDFHTFRFSTTNLINVTTLHLGQISIYKCLDFLIQLPNLIEYQQNLPLFPERYEPKQPRLDRFITLPNLQVFGWSFGMRSWDAALLTYITLPSLKHLRWMSKSGHDVHLVGIDSVCQVLLKPFIGASPNLRQLYWSPEFGRNDADAVFDLRHVLSCTDGIEEVHLAELLVETNKCDALLEFLTLTPIPTDSTDTNFLPRMKALFLDDGWSSRAQKQLLDSLLTMLESRRSLPSGGTAIPLERLRLSNQNGPPLERELNRQQYRRLADLVEGGLCVEFVEGPGGIGRQFYEEDTRSIRSLDLSIAMY